MIHENLVSSYKNYTYEKNNTKSLNVYYFTDDSSGDELDVKSKKINNDKKEKHKHKIGK